MDKVVFYDGDCGLCQRSVRALVSLDSKKELLFAPLNGETYKTEVGGESDMSTVVFLSDGKLFYKSDAVIEIGRRLGGVKSLLLLLKLIPRFIRDTVYNFIARNRKKVSCIILPRDQRFLK